jgi:prepilin-type N-terminal cleavage/methylation domain-containing protein
MKKKFSNISGFSLIEILIGIVITSIMMGAMYTSYTVVNNSYSQVTGRASVSAAGRDVSGMLIRELRMAGFRYYGDNLFFDDGTGINGRENNHYPIIIKEPAGNCCDRLEIVYGDYDSNQTGDEANPRFLRYKVIYFAGLDDDNYNLYKVKLKWHNLEQEWRYVYGGETGRVYPEVPITIQDAELLRKYVVGMDFVPIDKNGQRIDTPLTINDNSDKLSEIRMIDLKITFRSKDVFFKKKLKRKIESFKSSLRHIDKEDKFLRDSIVLSVFTRNVGS